MKLNISLIAGLFLCTCHVTFAQDHLVPTENYYSSYPYQHTYYNFIRNKLLADLDDKLLVQAVVLPSFQPEYVIAIRKEDKAYQLVFRTLSKSIWSVHREGEKAVEALKMSESKRSVSRELGQQLHQLYFEAVCQTRYPKRKYIIGMNGERHEELSIGADGTTYSFTASAAGHGNRTGETWSPRENTPMSSLVILTDQLAAFAKGDGAEAALLERATLLYKHIATE